MKTSRDKSKLCILWFGLQGPPTLVTKKCLTWLFGGGFKYFADKKNINKYKFFGWVARSCFWLTRCRRLLCGVSQRKTVFCTPSGCFCSNWHSHKKKKSYFYSEIKINKSPWVPNCFFSFDLFSTWNSTNFICKHWFLSFPFLTPSTLLWLAPPPSRWCSEKNNCVAKREKICAATRLDKRQAAGQASLCVGKEGQASYLEEWEVITGGEVWQVEEAGPELWNWFWIQTFLVFFPAAIYRSAVTAASIKER